ncbi:MAG: type IV pilus secretin PilQ [Candidatus Tectomicrobia bacterium]|nr:type IV pilus secretin PilQ [Candidatus Tectomicrobia bacterium]
MSGVRDLLLRSALALCLLLGGSVQAQEAPPRPVLTTISVEGRGEQTRVVLTVQGTLLGYDLVAAEKALTVSLNDVQPVLLPKFQIVSNPLVPRWSVAPVEAGRGTKVELQLGAPVTFVAKRLPQGLEIILRAVSAPPPPAAAAPAAPAPQERAEKPAEPPAPAASLPPTGEPVEPPRAEAAVVPAPPPAPARPAAAQPPEPAPAPPPREAPKREAPSAAAAPPPPAEKMPQAAPPSPPRAPAPPAPAKEAPVVAAPKPAAAPPAAAAERPAAPPQPAFTGQKISLDFHNADINNVLRALAEVSGLNVITSEDVKGALSIRMEEVPWDQALDVILKVKGLVKREEGNILRILTLQSLKVEDEARRAEVEAESRMRVEKARALKAEQEVEVEVPLTEKLVPILYANAEQIKANLEPFLSKDRKGAVRGFINVNKHTNTIIIRDTEKNLRDIQTIIDRLDKPTPQVIIEARIVEATLDFARDLGVQWGSGLIEDELRLRGGLNPATGAGVNLPAVGANSALDIAVGNLANTRVLDLRLSAFQSEGKARIITMPRISTLDNKEAVIQRGDRIPIRVLNQQGVTSTEFVDANLTLTVTPHVTLDDFIGMRIVVNLDEPDFSRTSVDGIPTIVTRNARTEALVKNGNTMVIGGLLQRTMSDNENQVPGIARIPLFGRLFRRSAKSEQNRELLIFISPTIIRREGSAAAENDPRAATP